MKLQVKLSNEKSMSSKDCNCLSVSSSKKKLALCYLSIIYVDWCFDNQTRRLRDLDFIFDSIIHYVLGLTLILIRPDFDTTVCLISIIIQSMVWQKNEQYMKWKWDESELNKPWLVFHIILWLVLNSNKGLHLNSSFSRSYKQSEDLNKWNEMNETNYTLMEILVTRQVSRRGPWHVVSDD